MCGDGLLIDTVHALTAEPLCGGFWVYLFLFHSIFPSLVFCEFDSIPLITSSYELTNRDLSYRLIESLYKHVGL